MPNTFTLKVNSQNTRHTRVTIFNRGGKAGELTILSNDLDELTRRLTGSVSVNQNIESVGPGASVTGMKIGRAG
jgi:hypothetical protein